MLALGEMLEPAPSIGSEFKSISDELRGVLGRIQPILDRPEVREHLARHKAEREANQQKKQEEKAAQLTS